jgi:hypothetical protein
MIAAQPGMGTGPGPSWAEQGERAWVAAQRAVDVVVGPPPRRRGTAGARPSLAVGALAGRAALWGLALGLLAPATTALVLVSGLGTEGASVVGSTDAGLFLGFLPLLGALVTTLLAFVHWPLRDVRRFHRELAVGWLLVGVVALVGLRAHGAAVTGDRWDHEPPFAGGSLVLHLLVVWSLVRLATGDLTALHVRRAAPPPGRVPAVAAGARPVLAWDAPRHLATAALALRSVVGGVVVAAAAGAAAGTVVVPGVGTLAGGYLGAIYGLVPTAIGTAALVTVVSWRRDTDPRAVAGAVGATLAVVVAGVLAAAWPFLHAATLPGLAGTPTDPARAWLAGAVVVVLLLRRLAPRLAATYTDLVPTDPG